MLETKTIVSDETIITKIYYLRGLKVMLDVDLAELYQVPTKQLNRAVQRNQKRFPDDFMFQLEEVEFQNLKCQNGTSSWGGRRYAPYAFTEEGVAMLSGVLTSERAIMVNIQIMRIFTKTRKLLVDHAELRFEVEKIKGRLDNHDKNMEIVFRYLDELIEVKSDPTPRRRIGYKSDEL